MRKATRQRGAALDWHSHLPERDQRSRYMLLTAKAVIYSEADAALPAAPSALAVLALVANKIENTVPNRNGTLTP